MKVTNNLDLPSAFVNLSEDIRVPVEGSYSATEIIKGVKEILLTRRHFDEITVDVADRVWLIFGTAVHHILENADDTGFAEVQMEMDIDESHKFTGKMDLYNEEEQCIEDYKTATVWKVIHAEFDDYKKQGLAYDRLALKRGLLVKKLKFHMLLKDWSPRDLKLAKLRGDFYPEHPIYTWEFEITESDRLWFLENLNSRFDLIKKYETLSDDDIPECTPEERWATPDKFAIYEFSKNGEKKSRATKLCDTIEDAQQYASTLAGKYEIEVRKGENKKCNDYCACHEFCNFYRKQKEEK